MECDRKGTVLSSVCSLRGEWSHMCQGDKLDENTVTFRRVRERTGWNASYCMELSVHLCPVGASSVS